MDDDDAYLRNSMAHGEIEQDRRLILKKLQQRRRGGAAASAMSQDPDFSDEEEEYPQDDDFDLELLRDVQEAHQQDEEMIGGRAEDGQEVSSPDDVVRFVGRCGDGRCIFVWIWTMCQPRSLCFISFYNPPK